MAIPGWREKKVKGGVRWSLTTTPHSYCNPKTEQCHGREIWGFTPDPPDMKQKKREQIFVKIWKVLEENESLSMDDEDDRLVLCGEITDWIEQNLPDIPQKKGQKPSG